MNGKKLNGLISAFKHEESTTVRITTNKGYLTITNGNSSFEFPVKGELDCDFEINRYNFKQLKFDPKTEYIITPTAKNKLVFTPIVETSMFGDKTSNEGIALTGAGCKYALRYEELTPIMLLPKCFEHLLIVSHDSATDSEEYGWCYTTVKDGKISLGVASPMMAISVESDVELHKELDTPHYIFDKKILKNVCAFKPTHFQLIEKNKSQVIVFIQKNDTVVLKMGVALKVCNSKNLWDIHAEFNLPQKEVIFPKSLLSINDNVGIKFGESTTLHAYLPNSRICAGEVQSQLDCAVNIEMQLKLQDLIQILNLFGGDYCYIKHKHLNKFSPKHLPSVKILLVEQTVKKV